MERIINDLYLFIPMCIINKELIQNIANIKFNIFLITKFGILFNFDAIMIIGIINLCLIFLNNSTEKLRLIYLFSCIHA
jgi:hypothetical protein